MEMMGIFHIQSLLLQKDKRCNMKYGIIIGSHRKKSQSTKVGKFVANHLKKVDKTAKTYVLDLAGNPLPFWDEDRWKSGSKINKQWAPYSHQLKGCDAFVIVSPEWSGMVPAGLKNFFLHCDTNELAHKPALIVTVSAGRGGSYPVAELRMSSYKNTHICYIPEHVIVQNVKDVLNDTKLDESNKADAYIKKRLEYSLKVLREYGKAFSKISNNKVLDYKNYPYGM
jgi:NAD(P)H-dependent FMN reductase